MGQKRKILISYGYGAGWTTWNEEVVQSYMLTYQPIIDFLEAGNRFTREDFFQKNPGDPIHPLLQQLQDECLEKFGQDYVCVLGADGLQVVTVDGQVRVTDYDGAESYITRDSNDGWL